jgi:DNA-binding MarR family transcriptional regulator
MDPAVDDAPLSDSVAIANELRPLVLRLARHLRGETHALGVTGGQVSLLVAIGLNTGITAQELAARERISAPGVSGHLARLEGLGLLRRVRAMDRRSVGLYLTQQGTEVLESVKEQRTTWLAERLENVPDEDRVTIVASIAAFRRLLADED